MPGKKTSPTQPERKPLTPEQLQELYGITFSDGERKLLTYSNDLLNVREEQWAYLLKMALTPCKCPACQGIICQRSADRDWNPQIHMPDDAYVCPRCGTLLTWYLEITGGQGFTLNPGQTIKVGEGPVPAAVEPMGTGTNVQGRTGHVQAHPSPWRGSGGER